MSPASYHQTVTIIFFWCSFLPGKYPGKYRRDPTTEPNIANYHRRSIFRYTLQFTKKFIFVPQKRDVFSLNCYSIHLSSFFNFSISFKMERDGSTLSSASTRTVAHGSVAINTFNWSITDRRLS